MKGGLCVKSPVHKIINKMATVKETNVPKATRPTVRMEHVQPVDSKTVIVQHDEKQELKIAVRKPTPQWLSSLYNSKLLSLEELADIYDSIRYIGFNRELMLFKMEAILKDPKICVQAIIACALRGPQAASILKLKNGKSLADMGIPGSGKMGTEDLSCQRIASSTADLAAFYMKELNVPKRIQALDCPGWLQFPTAGSIKLPANLRDQHRIFAAEFSKVIGGVFREDIYRQMSENAYLDENLHLFD